MKGILSVWSPGPLAIADTPRDPIRLPSPNRNGRTAVIEIRGALVDSPSRVDHDAVLWSDITEELERLTADTSVDRVLIKITSPGGTVYGLDEARAALVTLAAEKPTYVHATDCLCSAALWFSCVPKARVHASRLTMVGSIGAFSAFLDTSEALGSMGLRVVTIRSGPFKGVPQPGEAITPEIEAELQRTIDGLAEAFVRDLSEAMKLPPARLEELATGSVWLADQASALGLIHRVCTAQEAAADLEEYPLRTTPPKAAAAASPMAMEDENLALQFAQRPHWDILAKWSALTSPGILRATPRDRARYEERARGLYPKFACLVDKAQAFSDLLKRK